jgi:hypothetical protein
MTHLIQRLFGAIRQPPMVRPLLNTRHPRPVAANLLNFLMVKQGTHKNSCYLIIGLRLKAEIELCPEQSGLANRPSTVRQLDQLDQLDQ